MAGDDDPRCVQGTDRLVDVLQPTGRIGEVLGGARSDRTVSDAGEIDAQDLMAHRGPSAGHPHAHPVQAGAIHAAGVEDQDRWPTGPSMGGIGRGENAEQGPSPSESQRALTTGRGAGGLDCRQSGPGVRRIPVGQPADDRLQDPRRAPRRDERR